MVEVFKVIKKRVHRAPNRNQVFLFMSPAALHPGCCLSGLRCSHALQRNSTSVLTHRTGAFIFNSDTSSDTSVARPSVLSPPPYVFTWFALKRGSNQLCKQSVCVAAPSIFTVNVSHCHFYLPSFPSCDPHISQNTERSLFESHVSSRTREHRQKCRPAQLNATGYQKPKGRQQQEGPNVSNFFSCLSSLGNLSFSFLFFFLDTPISFQTMTLM